MPLGFCQCNPDVIVSSGSQTYRSSDSLQFLSSLKYLACKYCMILEYFWVLKCGVFHYITINCSFNPAANVASYVDWMYAEMTRPLTWNTAFICVFIFWGGASSRASSGNGEVLYTSGPHGKASFSGRQSDQPISRSAQRNKICQLVAVRLWLKRALSARLPNPWPQTYHS